MITIFMTLLLTIVLFRLAIIDVETLRLPDVYTLPLIAVGLPISLLDGGIGLVMSLAGGIIGFALFGVIGHYYFKQTGTEGLGLGDAKLFAASGTWLGPMALPYVLLVAAGGGLASALWRKTKRESTQREIAFGPWLAFGFWSVWFVQTSKILGH